jgi:hypothetical protein
METMETMKRAEVKMFHDFSMEIPKGKHNECVVFFLMYDMFGLTFWYCGIQHEPRVR